MRKSVTVTSKNIGGIFKKAIKLLKEAKCNSFDGCFLYCEVCRVVHIYNEKTSKECFAVYRAIMKKM